MAVILWDASFKLGPGGGAKFVSPEHGLQAATMADMISAMLNALTLIHYAAHRAHERGKVDLKKCLINVGTNDSEQTFSKVRGHGALNRGRHNSNKLPMSEFARRGT